LADDDPLPPDPVGAAFAKVAANPGVKTPLEARHLASATRPRLRTIMWVIVLGALLALVLTYALLQLR
jgi:type VI protein secretion system component VasF